MVLFIERARTGVIGLDELLGGGFPKSVSIFLEGTRGLGKGILASQFLKEGLKNGESCAYICVDDSPPLIRMKMEHFGVDVKQNEEEQLLIFVDCFSRQVGGTQEEYSLTGSIGFETLAPLLTRVKDKLDEKNTVQRTVIDTATSLFAQMDGQEMMHCLNWLKERFVKAPHHSSLWLGHKTTLKKSIYSILLDSVGGIIEMRFKEASQEAEKELRITSMPFTTPTPRWIGYIITDTGILLQL